MRVNNSTVRFAGFVQDLQESFWGDFQGQTRQVLKRLLETDAEQRMTEYSGLRWHERANPEEGVDYRNGFYERDYVTPLECFACVSRAAGSAYFCRSGSSRCNGARRRWQS